MPTFQPTLPARGATNAYPLFFPTLAYFNPRSPHGERRFAGTNTGKRPLISTHAPRTGSDPEVAGTHRIRADISTHAPRTGSDSDVQTYTSFASRFQPTLPARGATNATIRVPLPVDYFNPRSPHGERPGRASVWAQTARFQPTLPARGATLANPADVVARRKFQPTLPARGATPCGCHIHVGKAISTHAPRTGSD